MKLNKKAQYGLLFTLYLCRSGRATVEAAAANLNLSYPFLCQVARLLRIGGVINSVKGPHGGYEIEGEPTVSCVLTALSNTKMLTKAEYASYVYGTADHRALAQLTRTIVTGLNPILSRKIKNVGAELVVNELASLDRVDAAGLEN